MEVRIDLSLTDSVLLKANLIFTLQLEGIDINIFTIAAFC